ncbi:MAG: hypothetical protein FJ312_08825 [SAR202 cluster bacterium]|nr:hypothetical protein [SAR202 cluster bacterium]
MAVKGKTAKAHRVGEVVSASTAAFQVHCHKLYEAPPLGSLIRCGTDGSLVYGVVANILTESLDPSRKPIARGADEDSEEAVYRSNPQLTRLLATRFDAVAVGFQDSGGLHRYLAPLPPRVHSFAYRCDEGEAREFTESLEPIAVLLGAPIASQDEVVAAFLRLASRAHPDPQAFLVRAGKELAVQLIGQSQRLNAILRRLSR